MLIKITYWQSPPGISTFILFLTFQSLRKNKNSKIDFCFKKARKNCSIRILAKFVTQGFNEPRKVSQNYKYVTQLVNLVYIYCKLKKPKKLKKRTFVRKELALWYFKLRLFDPTEIIVWNILGLQH